MSQVDKPRYRTRKADITTNVLGVYSHDMQINYVLSGWEGSTQDSRVLRDAISCPNGLVVPNGMLLTNKHMKNLFVSVMIH